MTENGRGNPKFLDALRTPVAEPPLSKSATDKMMTTDSPSIAQIILPHAGNNIDAKIEESELSFSSILTS